MEISEDVNSLSCLYNHNSHGIPSKERKPVLWNIYRNSVTGEFVVVPVETPFERRLRRMKRRLGLKLLKGKGYKTLLVPFKYFITLTFRGRDYKEFKEQLHRNGSRDVSRFLNALRTEFHRKFKRRIRRQWHLFSGGKTRARVLPKDYHKVEVLYDPQLYYFWVVEKGHNGTYRYHYHIMTSWVPKMGNRNSYCCDRRECETCTFTRVRYRSKKLEKLWKRGFVTVEKIRKPYASALYASKYLSKEGCSDLPRSFGCSALGAS